MNATDAPAPDLADPAFLALVRGAAAKKHDARAPEESAAHRAYCGAFVAGRRFRVVGDGAALVGMQPHPGGGHRGWSRPLAVGEVLTCAGESMTAGDGVPAIKWRGPAGEHLAADCTFDHRLVLGGVWGGQVPAPGYLEPCG